MEIVVSYYSHWWFAVFVGGIALFVLSGYQLLTAERLVDRYVWQLVLAMSMIIVGNGLSNAPETNVVTLAPGEELVGSDLSGTTLSGRTKARVIVRLPDGKLSVRDFLVPSGKELEIRSSTPIGK